MKELKEKIMGWMENRKKPVEAGQIANGIQANVDDVQTGLEELEMAGQLVTNKKQQFALPSWLGMAAGYAMSTSKGGAFVRKLNADGEKDVFLNMPGEIAMNGDLVLMCMVNEGERPRADLVRILKRAHETIVGTVVIEKAYVVKKRPQSKKKGKKAKKGKKREGRELIVTIRLSDRHIAQRIEVVGSLQGAVAGDLVVLKIVRWPEKHKAIRGEIQKVLGASTDINVRLRSLADQHGLPDKFSIQALNQAQQMPAEVEQKDLDGRQDLRGLLACTIDGADAKDFDDAISLEQKEDNSFVLGVHIADVSHYVKPGSAIDKDALERGTSVYLPRLTLPMLPEALSNNLCSLMPNVDRLTLSCIMYVRDGQVQDYEITPSVIRSSARLIYEDVNKMLDGHPSDVPAQMQEMLRQMAALSEQIRAHRRSRGSIDFDLPEPEIILDGKGTPVDIFARERGVSHRMIEDFMLLANETVAKHTKGKDIPILYRVHEEPDQEKVAELEQFLNNLNIRIKLGENPKPIEFQHLLSQVEGGQEAEVIARVMLRSFKRAAYSELPKGHFGLAAEDYCHFTSPIRRYPDLVVHRMLKLRLQEGKNRKAETSWRERMPELAASCSQLEQRATQAERDGDDLMCAYYMSEHIGEKFEGTVSGVNSWGFYVALKNTVEGMVPIASLQDIYILDEAHCCLIGEHSRRVIRLGDNVKVRVEKVDLEAAQIEFSLIENDKSAAGAPKSR